MTRAERSGWRAPAALAVAIGLALAGLAAGLAVARSDDAGGDVEVEVAAPPALGGPGTDGPDLAPVHDPLVVTGTASVPPTPTLGAPHDPGPTTTRSLVIDAPGRSTTSARPTSGTPSPTTAPAVPARLDPGVWAVDARTGAARRLADGGVASPTGPDVVVARGLDLHAVPVGGGAPAFRFRVPRRRYLDEDVSRATVAALEASPAGHVVATTSAPQPDGHGRVVVTGLYDAAGRVVDDDLAFDGAWTPDGTTWVHASSGARGLVGLRMDGTKAFEVATGCTSDLRPSDDGAAVYGWTGSSDTWCRVDLASGETTPVPDLTQVDPGPGGLLAGAAAPVPGRATPPGVHVQQPGGAVRRLTERGAHPRWSGDGALLAAVDATAKAAPGAFDVLRTFDAAGRQLAALSARPGSAFAVHEGRGPQWAPSSSTLIVVVG